MIITNYNYFCMIIYIIVNKDNIKIYLQNKNATNNEKIICLTTGKVFNSVKQAEQFYGMKKSNIRKCCKGERETCGKLPDGTKLKWMFLKDYKSKGGE